MKNPLKARLRDGKPAYGVGLSIGHPDVAEIIGKLGYDWAFVDMEHTPMDFMDVELLLQGMSSSSTVPIVRVAWNDMVMIKKALDIGAYGVIVPWVNSREDALRAVQAVKYPPDGLRGYGPRRPSLSDPDYQKTANDEVMLVVQIETQHAVDHIDEILSVPGIDATLIGPNDLSLSLGVFAQWENPKYSSAVERVRESCVRNAVCPGIVAFNDIEKRYKEGFRFFLATHDVAMLTSAGLETLKRCRAIYRD